jgi:hypothetical protein
VRAVLQERTASAHLEAEGYVVDGKSSPWLTVLRQAHKSFSTLSHRLRLSPQGRSPTNPKRAPSVSYYDRMRLADGGVEAPRARPWNDWEDKGTNEIVTR